MKYALFVFSILVAGATAVDAQALTVRCTDPQIIQGSRVRVPAPPPRDANGRIVTRNPITQAPNVAQRDQRRDERFAPQPSRVGSSIRVCNN